MDGATGQNEKVLDQFTRQAEAYARLASPRTARPSPILALLGLSPDDNALDVACGAGSLSIQVAPSVAHVTGIDLTPAMIEQARKAQTEHGIDNIDWQLGDIAALPFADGRFSLVLCRAAFHHLDRAGDVLAEMRRVCADEGRVAVLDFGFPEDKASAFGTFERKRDPSHVHAHTLAELRALGRDCGLVEHVVQALPSGELPFEAILASSRPDDYSIEQIRAMMLDDARSRENRLGLSARLAEDGAVFVTYPQAIIVWGK
jgi:ubiquinone/menaquinone biosynthesis C-methylase UbiE